LDGNNGYPVTIFVLDVPSPWVLLSWNSKYNPLVSENTRIHALVAEYTF